MRHQEFLAGVATRAGLSNDEARTAADAALAVLAEHLPADDRSALAAALPTLLEQEALESGGSGGNGGSGAGGGADLVADVAGRTGWARERADYAFTAVVGQLAAEDADLGARIRDALPVAVGESATATLPPDAASEGQQGRPQPVDEEELGRALSGLQGWAGDTRGIERTIGLPSERLDLVLDRIHRAQRAAGHRVHIVERTPTSLTLRARTESLQAVTTSDLDLARRVDEAVTDVGSGG